MSVCISTAQARANCASPSWAPANSGVQWIFSALHVHFDFAGSHKTVVLTLMSRHSFASGDPKEFLLLQLRECQGLGKALGRFFYQDLVTSAPTAAGPSLRILRASLHGPGVKRSWSRSFRSPCGKLLWRSCCIPRQRGLRVKILKILCVGACVKVFWDAHRKFLCQDLVSSSGIDLYSRSCCCSCDHV